MSLAAGWINVLQQMEARREHIEAALAYCEGTHDYDDVVSMVMQNRLIWRALPNSFAIFEIVTFPKQKHLHGFLAGGDLTELRSIQDELQEFARQAGCSKITLSGRRGWVKALKDLNWQESCVTLSCDVTAKEASHEQKGRIDLHHADRQAAAGNRSSSQTQH